MQPNLPVWNENISNPSNEIPYPEYLYLSISAFFTNLTAPNKRISITGELSYLWFEKIIKFDYQHLQNDFYLKNNLN